MKRAYEQQSMSYNTTGYFEAGQLDGKSNFYATVSHVSWDTLPLKSQNRKK